MDRSCAASPRQANSSSRETTEQNRLDVFSRTADVIDRRLPISFASGDRVKFRDGAFAGFDATVFEVDAAARVIHLVIPASGRETPVAISFDEAAQVLEPADP